MTAERWLPHHGVRVTRTPRSTDRPCHCPGPAPHAVQGGGPAIVAATQTGGRPVKVVLLGVRGSTAAPGQEFVRYGGHTSCVAVTPDGATDPTLVLDAGTGLRDLTGLLSTQAFRGSILLSHLHWDHVQGL